VSDDFEVRDGVSVVYVRALGKRVAKSESIAMASSVLSDLAPATLATTVQSDPDGVIRAADAWIAQAAERGIATLDTAVEASDVGALLAASARRMLLGSEPEVTYFHHNHLGTTSVSTDADGELIQRAEHYPYGEPRYESHGYLSDYSFTGQERDEATGLSYHSARYLDTRVARWVSADPLFISSPRASLKRTNEVDVYGYATNGPVNGTDPTGLGNDATFERSAEANAISAMEHPQLAMATVGGVVVVGGLSLALPVLGASATATAALKATAIRASEGFITGMASGVSGAAVTGGGSKELLLGGLLGGVAGALAAGVPGGYAMQQAASGGIGNFFGQISAGRSLGEVQALPILGSMGGAALAARGVGDLPQLGLAADLFCNTLTGVGGAFGGLAGEAVSAWAASK